MKLPDVNVWLAATWGRHPHHEAAKEWFEQETDDRAFCRVTQMGLLRLATNPAVAGIDTLSRIGAWDLVDDLMADPRVRFVGEPEGIVPLWVAFSKKDDRSHKLWTDDYLAAFARAAAADFVTLDNSLTDRYPSVRVIALPAGP
jgi:hypothetical protein